MSEDSIAPIQPSAAFGRRFLAYAAERFPLPGYTILIVSYVSSNHFLAEVLTWPNRPVTFNWATLAAAVAVFCAFFHIRVFDEHKDYAQDCLHHPNRVLQRGVITLQELRGLGLIAIAVQIALGAWHSWAALLAVLITLGFTLLMLKEFFVGEWLKRHFLVYALSHMLVMPLLAGVVYSFSTGQHIWQAPGWFWVYAFVGFFVTFNWEISRKIRAPSDEREGIDSYTKVFGTMGAAWMVLGVRVVDTCMVAAVGWHLGLAWWFYLALVVLFMLPLGAFLRFRRDTTPKHAAGMEKAAGIYIVAFDLCIAVAIAVYAGTRIGVHQ